MSSGGYATAGFARLSIVPEAIGYLYHALLLQEIGIDSDLLRRWVFDGPRSFIVQYAFREAGLLPEELKEPPGA